jgi:methylthioribose-1-phosphate isomerase
VARIGDVELLPDGVPVRHPAFDVTPARLVTAIVTEAGVAREPYAASLRELFR